MFAKQSTQLKHVSLHLFVILCQKLLEAHCGLYQEMEGCDKMMKASIRKTIMIQESIFKQQVKELHRLYYMQTRLMAEKEKRANPHFLRGSAVPAWGSCNSLISENGSGNIPSVLGIKRPRSSASNQHSFEDGCEVELSLGIRGKVTKQKPNTVLRQVEGGEIRSCGGRVGLGISALQSSSRSDPKIKNPEENFHHLQLQLSI